MNSPLAQIRTRRSSIVVRKSLRNSIIGTQDADGIRKKLSIEEKAAQFDAHFPSPKPNSQKSRRATRRGSVAMMQNLKDLCHAQGHQEESKIAHVHHETGHTTDFHPEEKKKNDFIAALRTEFLVDDEHKDNHLYSDANLLKRESLKFEKRIQFTLKRLWALVDINHDGTITKPEYLELHKRLVRALVGVVDEEEEKKTGEEDWLHDTPLTKGHQEHEMGKPQFISAFFRMVDVWTENICVDEYSSFLEDAFDRISIMNEDGTFSYKPLDKIRKRGRRSSVIVMNGKMMAAQLLALQNAEKNKLKQKQKKKKKKKQEYASYDPKGNWWDRLYSKGKFWKQLEGQKDVVTKTIDPIPGIGSQAEGLDGITLDFLSVNDKDRTIRVDHVQNGQTRGFAQFKMDMLHFANIRKNNRVALYVDRFNAETGQTDPVHLMDVDQKNWRQFYEVYFSNRKAGQGANMFLSSFRNVATRTQYGLPLSICSTVNMKPVGGGEIQKNFNLQAQVVNVIGAHVRQMRSATEERNKIRSRGVAVRNLRPITQGGQRNRMQPGRRRFGVKKKKKRRQIDWLKVGGTGLSIGGISFQGGGKKQLPPVSPIVNNNNNRRRRPGQRAKTPSFGLRNNHTNGGRRRKMQILNFGISNSMNKSNSTPAMMMNKIQRRDTM